MKVSGGIKHVLLTINNLALKTHYSWALPEAQAYRLVTEMSNSPEGSRLKLKIEDVKH